MPLNEPWAKTEFIIIKKTKIILFISEI